MTWRYHVVNLETHIHKVHYPALSQINKHHCPSRACAYSLESHTPLSPLGLLNHLISEHGIPLNGKRGTSHAGVLPLLEKFPDVPGTSKRTKFQASPGYQNREVFSFSFLCCCHIAYLSTEFHKTYKQPFVGQPEGEQGKVLITSFWPLHYITTSRMSIYYLHLPPIHVLSIYYPACRVCQFCELCKCWSALVSSWNGLSALNPFVLHPHPRCCTNSWQELKGKVGGKASNQGI